jgi:hypothetical protein
MPSQTGRDSNRREAMPKHLRIIVPAAQVVTFLALVILGKLSHDERIYFNYFAPARRVYLQLNFPVLAAWSPLVYVLDHFGRKLPANGVVFDTLTLVGGLLFLSTIAIFWYLLVREAELRRSGKSLLKSSRSSVQVAVSVVIITLGMIAAFRSYSEVTVLWYSRRAEGVLNGFFLACWAILLVILGIRDLFSLLRRQSAAGTAIQA